MYRMLRTRVCVCVCEHHSMWFWQGPACLFHRGEPVSAHHSVLPHLSPLLSIPAPLSLFLLFYSFCSSPISPLSPFFLLPPLFFSPSTICNGSSAQEATDKARTTRETVWGLKMGKLVWKRQKKVRSDFGKDLLTSQVRAPAPERLLLRCFESSTVVSVSLWNRRAPSVWAAWPAAKFYFTWDMGMFAEDSLTLWNKALCCLGYKLKNYGGRVKEKKLEMFFFCVLANYFLQNSRKWYTFFDNIHY